MKFVRNLQEIEANSFYLADIIHNQSDKAELAAELIGKGKAFLPFVYEGIIAFSPSKFIGYRTNSLEEHLRERSNRDGKDTNREINRILGTTYVEDDALHVALEDYCHRIGVPLQKHKHRFWPVQSAIRLVEKHSSAFDDLNHSEDRNDDPRYKEFMKRVYNRSTKVRDAVLKRAAGQCECNNCELFISKRTGLPYLETHHIVSLAASGDDDESNVIALCANHHREAHFGKNWEALNNQFLAILEQRGFR